MSPSLDQIKKINNLKKKKSLFNDLNFELKYDLSLGPIRQTLRYSFSFK
jgi:hypothetical protein